MTAAFQPVSSWHKEYYSCRQCSGLDHHLTKLCVKLKQALRKEAVTVDRYRKGSHAGQHRGCVTQGFLVWSDWIPRLQLVLDVVYGGEGVQLQLAAYCEATEVENPPPDHALVSDNAAQAVFPVAQLVIDWEKPVSIPDIHERRTRVQSMLQDAEPQLATIVRQFLEQLHEMATP